jgi:hypothetical protein
MYVGTYDFLNGVSAKPFPLNKIKSLKVHPWGQNYPPGPVSPLGTTFDPGVELVILKTGSS